MRVALVHDYLREFGGAERVLEALQEIFPEAPIYTAFLDLNGLGPHAKKIKDWNIKTSLLQYFPFAKKLISPLRIFAPKIFESFNLKEFDLVISSCNTYFAKAVKTKGLHLSYIHTPPRYLYGYTTSYNYKKHWWTRIGGEVANHFLRIWDFKASQNPEILLANSKNVQKRIQKFYRRESVVIYPPVDTLSFLRKKESIKKGSRKNFGMTESNSYYLSVSRLVRGKGVDIIVDACIKLGLPLKVVGSGPELEKLKVKSLSRAKPRDQKSKNIEFLGEVKDEELPELYANAKALIVASEDEDFGITAVESQAAGTPVIAPWSGGFLETVINNKTGVLYGDGGPVTMENLVEGLKCFNSLNHWNKEDLVKNAQKFSKYRFKKEIRELIESNLHT